MFTLLLAAETLLKSATYTEVPRVKHSFAFRNLSRAAFYRRPFYRR
jgi:hypothetical protein